MIMRGVHGAVLTSAAMTLLLIGCERPDDQETGSISRDDIRQARQNLDPAVAAALDSGNAAYRRDDYEAALQHYQQAVELEDGLAAAWFGIYMANLALGNVEEANAAVERAQSLAPEASLMHPDGDARP